MQGATLFPRFIHLPLIRTLLYWLISKEASSTTFWVFLPIGEYSNLKYKQNIQGGLIGWWRSENIQLLVQNLKGVFFG